MRNLQFEGWQRVSKAYFLRAYLNGEKVCVAPCNVNLDSFWYGGRAFMPRLYNDFLWNIILMVLCIILQS